MKIAFLGKGGSGKSTMATAFVRELSARGYRVLAIDADYNMDLTYNLGVEPATFLGNDPDFIKEYVSADRNGTFADALSLAKQRGVHFSAFPPDEFTARMSHLMPENIRIMTAGPHTDRVRSQEACSHSLAAPLKVYLPLLKLTQNDAVVIDERAGTDPVATGILSGIDVAAIVQEPTPNSRRVAAQIADELKLANIPYFVVNNKELGLEADAESAMRQILSHTP